MVPVDICLKFESTKLPTKQGDIDWDIVCEDYYKYILSPFSPEMVVDDDGNGSRNLLLNYLQSLPADELSKMSVLDFGCGPGNLIPHIAGKIARLVAVDASQGSLNKACSVAEAYRLKSFATACCNILDFASDERFDLIVSVNSLLPKTRREVIEIYATLCTLLKPGGRLVAILPSFDTTLYLRSLWEAHYREMEFDEEQIKAIASSFTQAKLLNETQLSYADDGHNSQCYHTQESIVNETRLAGLTLLAAPEKIHYPWELTGKFDYGYFPDAAEEIWDWFVIAEPAGQDFRT